MKNGDSSRAGSSRSIPRLLLIPSIVLPLLWHPFVLPPAHAFVLPPAQALVPPPARALVPPPTAAGEERPRRAAKTHVFFGTITDTECGPSHAKMLARGGMGDSDAECTRACIRLGATYGVLVGKKRRFYQLDDQEKPAPFAGRRVRIVGRRDGDSILVESIGPPRVR